MKTSSKPVLLLLLCCWLKSWPSTAYPVEEADSPSPEQAQESVGLGDVVPNKKPSVTEDAHLETDDSSEDIQSSSGDGENILEKVNVMRDKLSTMHKILHDTFEEKGESNEEKEEVSDGDGEEAGEDSVLKKDDKDSDMDEDASSEEQQHHNQEDQQNVNSASNSKDTETQDAVSITSDDNPTAENSELQSNNPAQDSEGSGFPIPESWTPSTSDADSELSSSPGLLARFSDDFRDLLDNVEDITVSLQDLHSPGEVVEPPATDSTDFRTAEARADDNVPLSVAPDERARIAVFPARANIDQALLLLRDLQRMLEERLDVFNIMLERFYLGEVRTGDQVSQIRNSLEGRRRHHYHDHHHNFQGFHHHHDDDHSHDGSGRPGGGGGGRRPGGSGGGGRPGGGGGGRRPSLDAHQVSDGHGAQQLTIINLFDDEGKDDGGKKKPCSGRAPC